MICVGDMVHRVEWELECAEAYILNEAAQNRVCATLCTEVPPAN